MARKRQFSSLSIIFIVNLFTLELSMKSSRSLVFFVVLNSSSRALLEDKSSVFYDSSFLNLPDLNNIFKKYVSWKFQIFKSVWNLNEFLKIKIAWVVISILRGKKIRLYENLESLLAYFGHPSRRKLMLRNSLNIHQRKKSKIFLFIRY